MNNTKTSESPLEHLQPSGIVLLLRLLGGYIFAGYGLWTVHFRFLRPW